MHWEVIVVGAGAAGLLAATRAAECGRRTLLLEKNRKPGVKILMSGGTRCNLTHNTDRRGIIDAFGKQGRFLHSSLAALGPRELVQLVEQEGVATKVEDTGKVFPVSDKATDVLEAFMKRFRRSGAVLSLDERLTSFERSPEGFRLYTARQLLLADHVIITTGGKSYPGSGTTGDAYAWAQAFGHTLVAPRPALTPIATSEPWVAALKGITIPDVALQVLEIGDANKMTVLDQRRGSFLFTHFGLSGPAPLDISRVISGHPHPNTLRLQCDFLPGIKEEAFTANLHEECRSAGRRELGGIMSRWLPVRLVEALLERAGVRKDQRGAELSKADRAKVVAAIKRQVISVQGTLGFGKAEVTAGGVQLDEINSSSMESKLVPNLYFAGEVLDLDGPIGGYNFQAAFSTGWLAGSSAALQASLGKQPSPT